MNKDFDVDYYNETEFKNSRFPTLFEELVAYTLSQVIKVNRNVYLSINIVSKETIKELNATYRNVDKETDVLSFPSCDEEEIANLNDPSPLVLGDIFICYDVCLKQAEERGHSSLYELCFLFSHGLLHLLGIHHDDEKSYKYMEDKLQEILTRKGENEDPWNLLNS